MTRPAGITRLCLFALIAHGGLVACTQTALPAATAETPASTPAIAVLEVAPTPPSASHQLNIGVQVFEHQAADAAPLPTPINAATFARIRSMEAHYLPVVLRNTLIASDQWGAVSVLPADDPAMDLIVHGRIIESTGARLVIEVRAVDSSGREWLANTYTGRAHANHYPHPRMRPGERPQEELTDPFQAMHSQIANDLLAARRRSNEQDLRALRRIAHLNHALDLSPDAFAGMLVTDADGYTTVARLPAGNEPLLNQVRTMRARHHMFIDTIDTYYDALYYDVKPLYDLWRQYSNEFVAEASVPPRANNAHDSAGASFESLRRGYDRHRWAKLFEEEFVGLASGFVNETAPAVLELSERVHGLTGSVEEQYAQWRALLRALFEIDRGRTAEADSTYP